MANENCTYCGGNKEIRNPTRNCDHLRYPENVNKSLKKEAPKSMEVKIKGLHFAIKFFPEDLKKNEKQCLMVGKAIVHAVNKVFVTLTPSEQNMIQKIEIIPPIKW